MRQRADSSAIDALAVAASRWISAGNNPAQLTASDALKRGYLKASWCAGTSGAFSGEKKSVAAVNGNWFCGVWLGAARDANPAVALYGDYAELEPAIEKYRKVALRIFFPFPNDLLSPNMPMPAADARALMQIVFDKNRLAAMAPQLGSSLINDFGYAQPGPELK